MKIRHPVYLNIAVKQFRHFPIISKNRVKPWQTIVNRWEFLIIIAFAGGFVNETRTYKSMAMSDLGTGPTVKDIAMARAPITGVMKADYFAQLSKNNDLPPSLPRRTHRTPTSS